MCGEARPRRLLGMNNALLPESLDTRMVFRAYAITAWVAGTFLFAFGPQFFPLELAGSPHGSGVSARVLGGIVAGAGCLAWSAALVEAPRVGRLMLMWWAIGHSTALGVIVIQVAGIIGKPGPGMAIAVGGLILAVMVFWYAVWTVDEVPWGKLGHDHQSIFGDRGARPTKELRSTYEEQIRAVAAQEERNRLARDLHDSIKQQIFVIQTAAATAQARFEHDPTGAVLAVEQVRSSAREAMTEMEVMLDQLRAAPLGNAGLVEALGKQCEALRFRTGADVQFTHGDLPPVEAFPPGAQEALFRIAQEALANVARHARAAHVQVSLDASPLSVQLRVDDDGAGFDQNGARSGMGLSNMRARAAAVGGTVAITTEPGRGALVRASVPRIPDDSSDLGVYRRRVMFWAAGVLFWIIVVGFGIIVPSQRWALVYRVPLLVVHLWLFWRVVTSYLRVRRAYRNQLPKKAGAQ
jgi:signal transduction histidine kinase